MPSDLLLRAVLIVGVFISVGTSPSLAQDDAAAVAPPTTREDPESDAETEERLGPADEDEAAEAETPVMNAAAFGGLKLRSLGPALMSGRIGDLAVNPSRDA
ncbi:MAG: hypothetical protein ACO3NL_09580 [Phycisphaerales bacterium]